MKKWMLLSVVGLIGLIWLMPNSPLKIAYVYSNSMEPVIQVNDAFLVRKTKRVEVGDIIMYRPRVLHAAFITHRVIQIGEKGLVTKGDHAPFPDQESGEPGIENSQIVGKVITFRGQPLVIPHVGKWSGWMHTHFKNQSKLFAVIFFLIGLAHLVIQKNGSKYKRKIRKRKRHLARYAMGTMILIGCVCISLQWNQVEMPAPMYTVKNNSVLPMWNFTKNMPPVAMPPFSQKQIRVDRQMDESDHMWTVQYPIVLPKRMLRYLHEKNPDFARGAAGIALFTWTMAAIQVFVSMIEGNHRVRLMRAKKRRRNPVWG